MLFPALNHTGAIPLIKGAELLLGNNIFIHYLRTEPFFFFFLQQGLSGTTEMSACVELPSPCLEDVTGTPSAR